MTQNADTADRERPQKLLLYILTFLLIAFSLWCGVLLWRTQVLRHDLEAELAWMRDVRQLHVALDRLRANPEASDAVALTPPRFESAADPELQVASASLRRALEELEGRLTEEASADSIWESTEAARGALMRVEGRIHYLVTELYERLQNLWNGLYLLIIASLLLAGSNLALLRLAQDRRQKIEAAHGEALRLSTQDSLTKVWNRDAILKVLRRELARAERHHSPLGVILVDIDNFQQVNVLLGHDQGDFLLEQLAGRLGAFVRPYDTMGRFGGDSFLIVLPACDDTATGNVAERLREAVNERDMEHALGRIRVTVSQVWVTITEPEDDVTDLLIHRLQERITSLQATGAGLLARLD